MKPSNKHHRLIASIRKLEKKLAGWSRLPLEEQAGSDLIAELATLTETVADALMPRRHFNKAQGILIDLTEQQTWAPEINDYLKEALRQLEKHHTEFIDPATPLPRHSREELQQLADQQIPVICLAIEQKKLPTTYCHEIRSAFRALFSEDKLPKLSYRHQQYIPQLLTESMRLHSDKVSSRWNEHLLETFVNYNFNYMGIFNRWKELRDAEFAAAATKGEEEACYWKWKATISHYNPKTGMAFDPYNDSLLKHMKRYLKLRKKQLLQKKRFAASELTKGIRTNNLAGDMAIRFITLYKTGEYPYKTQLEAADAYLAVHISKNGKEVSPQTLTKHDKNALYMPARKWYNKVVQIAKFLKQEYSFKDAD